MINRNQLDFIYALMLSIFVHKLQVVTHVHVYLTKLEKLNQKLIHNKKTKRNKKKSKFARFDPLSS